MTIRVGSEIKPLSDADPTVLMDKTRVRGVDAIEQTATAAKNAADVHQNDIATLKQQSANLKKTVDNSVERVALTDDNQLEMTNADGSKHLVQLPVTPNVQPLSDKITALEAKLQSEGMDVTRIKAEVGHVTHEVDVIESVFTYSGDTIPTIPDQPYEQYYITINSKTDGELQMTLPAPTGEAIPNGAVFHLVNASSKADIEILAPQGQTVGGATSATVETNMYVLLIKNGADWHVAVESITSAHEFPVTAHMITSALDRGDAPNTGSLKNLLPGWWNVPVDSTGISGRPPDSQGNLIVFRQDLTKGTTPTHSVMMAFGADSAKDPAVWVQYRNGGGGTWTKWQKLDDQLNGVDITAITADIAALKAGDADLVDKLGKLTTVVGGIYAPNKAVFDKAVDDLITSALVDFKAELVKEGWGPISGIPSQNDHPLPSDIPRIYATYGSAFPTSITGPTVTASTSASVAPTRSTSGSARIFVFFKNDAGQGNKVTGISVDGSLAARWQHRDYAIGGEAYRVFYSPGSFSEQTNTVQVLFRGN